MEHKTQTNQGLQDVIVDSTNGSKDQTSNQETGLPEVSSTVSEPVSNLSIGNTRSTEKLLDIEITLLTPHPEVMKVYVNKDLHGLEVTMKLVGQLEPIKVVKRNDRYLVFDGISRFIGATNLGWKKLDVEVFELTDNEIQDQAVLRNIRTKRSIQELCNQAELILGVLGSSQGKRRDRIGGLTSGDDDFCLAGKDRFEIACEVVGCEFSPSSLRRLLSVKDFEENGDDEVKGFGLMEKLEHGIIKINQAYKYMQIYQEEKNEQDKNALTEVKDYIKGNNFELFNESCENLNKIEDESVDCVVTSPPYYQMRHYPDGVRDTEIPQHGQERTVDEYIKKEVEIYSNLLPKLKDTGSLFIVISDSYDEGGDCAVVEKLIVRMMESGWSLVQKWFWVKDNPKPVSKNSKRLLLTHENMIWFCKNPKKYYYREFKMWKEGGFVIKPCNTKNRVVEIHSNKVYTISKPFQRFRTFLSEQTIQQLIFSTGFKWGELKDIDSNYRHQAPYPLVIPLLPILITTKIGDTVLDIFNGTSTTTAVALQLRRKAVGYDTDTDSIRFAEKRLKLVEQNLPTDKEVSEFENDYMEAA